MKENTKINPESQWIICLNKNIEFETPRWLTSNKVGKSILNKSNRLPFYDSGIPKIEEKLYGGFTLMNCCGIVIQCCDKLIIKFENNLIEFRKDAFCSIENEILKNIPDEIYKEVCHYF